MTIIFGKHIIYIINYIAHNRFMNLLEGSSCSNESMKSTTQPNGLVSLGLSSKAKQDL